MDQITHFFTGNIAFHRFQHIIGCMLQRHIQIVADIFPFLNCIQNFHGKFGRISIVQTYPFQAFYIGQCMKQFGQFPFFVNIQTIISKFLCYEHYFLNAFLYKAFSIPHQIFNGSAYMLSTH